MLTTGLESSIGGSWVCDEAGSAGKLGSWKEKVRLFIWASSTWQLAPGPGNSGSSTRRPGLVGFAWPLSCLGQVGSGRCFIPITA